MLTDGDEGKKTLGGGLVHGPVMNNPLLTGMLSHCRPPRFGGKAEDWQQFRRDWLEYVKMLQWTAPGQDLPDALLLQALKQNLDEETQRDLRRKKEKIHSSHMHNTGQNWKENLRWI